MQSLTIQFENVIFKRTFFPAVFCTKALSSLLFFFLVPGCVTAAISSQLKLNNSQLWNLKTFPSSPVAMMIALVIKAVNGDAPYTLKLLITLHDKPFPRKEEIWRLIPIVLLLHHLWVFWREKNGELCCLKEP